MHFVVDISKEYLQERDVKMQLQCTRAWSAGARDAEIRCGAENLRLSIAAVLYLFSVEVHLRIAVAISGNHQIIVIINLS